MNLLEVRLDGEIVLAAPVIVHDSAKARRAITILLESGHGFGVDGGIIGAVFAATKEEKSEFSHVGILLQVVDDYSSH